jgi:hypothetical protein
MSSRASSGTAWPAIPVFSVVGLLGFRVSSFVTYDFLGFRIFLYLCFFLFKIKDFGGGLGFFKVLGFFLGFFS